MATQGTRRRKTTAAADAENTETETTTENTEETETVARKKTEKKPIIPKDIDPEQYVTVLNGFQGRLVYRSPSTGEIYVWDEFGSEQEMTLRELQRAKNTYKNFFMNNWFMFEEDWVVDYLGVGKFYKHALSVDHFDDIFTQRPATIKKTLSEMSEGQKKSVAYRARQLIAENKIDSLSVITALEEGLGIELIEK